MRGERLHLCGGLGGWGFRSPQGAGGACPNGAGRQVWLDVYGTLVEGGLRFFLCPQGGGGLGDRILHLYRI